MKNALTFEAIENAFDAIHERNAAAWYEVYESENLAEELAKELNVSVEELTANPNFKTWNNEMAMEL